MPGRPKPGRIPPLRPNPKIDFDGLDQRILAVDVPARRYTSLHAGEAGVLFYTEQVSWLLLALAVVLELLLDQLQQGRMADAAVLGRLCQVQNAVVACCFIRRIDGIFLRT